MKYIVLIQNKIVFPRVFDSFQKAEDFMSGGHRNEKLTEIELQFINNYLYELYNIKQIIENGN